MGGAHYVVYNTSVGWKIRLVSGKNEILFIADTSYKSSNEALYAAKQIKKASLFAKVAVGKMVRRPKTKKIQQ